MDVVDRHSVKLVMRIKLHATDNCSLIGRVVVGVVGVVMSMLGAILGALDLVATGPMVTSIVGVLLLLGFSLLLLLFDDVESLLPPLSVLPLPPQFPVPQYTAIPDTKMAITTIATINIQNNVPRLGRRS